MPNWVDNTVQISGQEKTIKELKQKLNSKECKFDFNAIIPRPEYIQWEYKYPDIEVKGTLYKEILKSFYQMPNLPDEKKQKILQALGVQTPEQIETYVEPDELKKAIQTWPDELHEYGKALMDVVMSNETILDWYAWDNSHWNTKWNACRAEITDESYEHGLGSITYTFDTAWSDPLPVINELSEQYPDIKIEWRWIEEQGIENLGERTYENGEMVAEDWPESCSKEAYEKMFEFWDNRDNYFYNPETDSYEYTDDKKHLYLFYEDGEYCGCAAGNTKKEAIDEFSDYNTKMTVKIAKQS